MQSLVFARILGSVTGFLVMILVEFAKILFKTATATSNPVAMAPEVNATVSNTKQVSPTTARPEQINAEDRHLLDALPSPATGQFGGASSFRSFVKGGQTVDMRLYMGDQPRIESVVKVPCERLHWMRAKTAFERVKLEVFTPHIATKAGLPFSFDGAQKFILASTNLKNVAAADPPQVRASPLDSVSSIAHTRFDTDADPAQAGVAVEVTGIVVSAGDATIRPQGKQPYTTFTVVLVTNTGEVSMSGIDLKEKFENRVYGIGDLVEVKKCERSSRLKTRVATRTAPKIATT
ncbi:hypothetical protein LP417_35260 (plasmid) [Polaromonas sp. P1-6]|nr:hypothetical protein LP417_35260 [Polaromonas sp. P1-6]